MGLMDVNISVSEHRTPGEFRVSEHTTVSTDGTICIGAKQAQFLPSSFRVESPGVVLHIDPLGVEEGRKADYILITHSHPDHFSLPEIEKAASEDTVLIGPKKVVEKATRRATRMVQPGDVLDLGTLQVTAVPAYSRGFPTHPRKNGNVGYVLDIDGVRIYHAGDTDRVPEIESIENLDLALVPIDGGVLTMTTKEAAILTNKLKPRTVIPMHYVTGKGKAEEFRVLINPDTEVVLMAE